MDEAKNPWTVTGQQEIYENPWIQVTEYKVLNPAGNPGIYGKVHFKNLAIGIIPLDGDGYTWIVGQWRFPLEVYSWEIIEGGGNLEVPPLESAKRELLEEAGIVAEHWEVLLEADLSNSVTDEKAVIFLATGLSFHAPEPEETEALLLKKIHWTKLFRMALRGEVRDSLTIMGVLKLYAQNTPGNFSF